MMTGGGLDDWERTAIRYGRATRDQPADGLLDDISADLAELRLALDDTALRPLCAS